MSANLPSSLVLVGAGKMGGAMLAGWIDTGIDPGAVVVFEPNPSAGIADLCRASGVRLNPELSAVTPPAALVLAIKPQSLGDAAPAVDRLAGASSAVISIMAGKTIADIRASLPRAGAVVRAMPNLPASIRRGITAACAGPGTDAAQKTMADALLRVVGELEWLDDEGLIDAVTALSGSGPAYVFHLAECMALAGEAAGLPAALAARLARVTVTGAGELLHRSELTPERLRHDVTSPGGTTAAALDVLTRKSGLQALVTEAIAAAKRRAGELSG